VEQKHHGPIGRARFAIEKLTGSAASGGLLLFNFQIWNFFILLWE